MSNVQTPPWLRPPTAEDVLADHNKRILELERTLGALIASETFCFPDETTDNPHLVNAGQSTLVAVSAAGVPQETGLNVLVYNAADVGDVTVGSTTPTWVVPVPITLGAVPYVPIAAFPLGIVAAVVVAADDSVIDPDDYAGTKITYAFA